jgi:hypothetical protein
MTAGRNRHGGRRGTAARASLAAALLTALLVLAEQRAGGDAVPGRPFSAQATGTALHVDAGRAAAGGPRLADVEVASSAATVDSGGLLQPVADETGRRVQPVGARGSKSFGRGVGVEVGLLRGAAGRGVELAVAGVSEAQAPPAAGPVHDLGPVRINPLVFATLARGWAAPDWSVTSCVIGRPVSSALGSASDVQVLGLGPEGSEGRFTAPVAATGGGPGTGRGVVASHSLTYLRPNPGGTFAIVSETRQSFAPVTLLRGSPAELTVELLGEFVLRATATGQAGGARVEYSPAGDPTPTTPVLRLVQRERVLEFTFQQIFGGDGFTLAVDPLVRVAVAEHARRPVAPGGQPDPGSQPVEAPDGRLAAAAVDAVRITLVDLPVAGSARTVDVRLGHMEVAAAVPEGGVACRLPVHKSDSPAIVEPGETFLWTISIPSRADALDGMSCDLVDIVAVDTAWATTGVRFRITEASAGGVIEGRKVTWQALGRYHPGDPPIVITIAGQLDPDSESGSLHDTVEVSAALTDCTGGNDRTGTTSSSLNGRPIAGSFTLHGPRAPSG